VKEGYIDLEIDDYEAGTLLHKLQLCAMGATHRIGAPSQNS